MRINYKNYPALNYLKYENIIQLKGFEKDKETIIKNRDDILSLFLENKNDFATNITVISENFSNASMLASEKLRHLINKEINEQGVTFCPKGTFIIGGFVVMVSMRHSIFENEINVFTFTKDGTFLSCARTRNGKYEFIIESKDEILISKKIDMTVSMNFALGYANLIMYCMLFMENAEVENKILEPKKKTKIYGCKYLNETDMNITHLDSKWFTNLVKSDAFKVRGHFRLQPKKKEGKWTRELIWINDFEKSGYTASARKLTQTQ